MATVFDVAKYILKKTGTITTMKLQKLVYYCQAWSLGWDDVPLFGEEFQAWANGPVSPDLFARHRGRFVVDSSFLNDIPDYDFESDAIETMDSVLEFYGDKEPQWLSELTHKEAPWKEARVGIPSGAPCSNIITKDSMQQYYGGL
ncbi:MAG: SocA family protein [Oscillospiraceae bacterium]|nr:SocA family protein [Oscillospiraceae bacterium]